MTRTQAIALAQRAAKAKPESYYAEPFQPHEWVIDAILDASRACSSCGGIDEGNTCCPPAVEP